MTSFIGLIFFFFTTTTEAYIPKVSTILERTVRNHGKATYLVDLEVSLEDKTKTYITKESWLIDKEGYSVTIIAKDILSPVDPSKEIPGTIDFDNRLHYLYKNNVRYEFKNGRIFSQPVKAENLEQYFLVRDEKTFETLLSKAGIAFSRSKSPKYEMGDKHDKQDFDPNVRLTRIGGTVQYGLGIPRPLETDKIYPYAWIEQDYFHLQKLRLQNQIEIIAEQYLLYADNFWYPRSRKISWDGGNAHIKLLNVKLVSASDPIRSKLSVDDLKPSAPTSPATTSSPTPTASFLSSSQVSMTVIEFYKRFR